MPGQINIVLITLLKEQYIKVTHDDEDEAT